MSLMLDPRWRSLATKSPHGICWPDEAAEDDKTASIDEGLPVCLLAGGPLDAPELIMAGSMLGPVFKRPAPGKLHQCLRMLGPRTVTRGAQVD